MARIRSDFDDHTTALEVIEGIDLGGRRAIVTGGASGIGSRRRGRSRTRART